MIGIMQGRLSPPIDGKLQAFPRITWTREFYIAQGLGIHYIEWVLDDGWVNTGFFSSSMSREANEIQIDTGVGIKYLCADLFMDYPLIRVSAEERHRRTTIMRDIISRCQDIGITGIVVPFVDHSGINSISELHFTAEAIRDVIDCARHYNIKLHLETNCGPHYTSILLREIDSPMVQINYDTGNSASLGFDPEEELTSYGRHIGHVHIKDRKIGGESVPLGEGDAHIEYVIQTLKRMGYAGDYTLQVARGEIGREVEWAKKNLEILRGYLDG